MTEWIIQTISAWGYVGIFLVMLAESIFPPIPSELIIPFAGFAAANGELNFFGVLIAATIGAVVGMLPWYFAGRLFAPAWRVFNRCAASFFACGMPCVGCVGCLHRKADG